MFAGDGVQSITLAQVGIALSTTTFDISAPGALSYQIVSTTAPYVYWSIPAGATYQGPALASSEYYINAV